MLGVEEIQYMSLEFKETHNCMYLKKESQKYITCHSSKEELHDMSFEEETHNLSLDFTETYNCMYFKKKEAIHNMSLEQEIHAMF